MATKLLFKADVDENGKIVKFYNKRGFEQDMKMFAGKSVKVEISKWTKTRSTKQNAYYHSCVIPFVLDGLVDAGYERYKLNSEVVHELLKSKFLKHDIANEETGETIEIVRSTADLSTSEFMDYIADIQNFSLEFLNVTIPDPNEQSMLAFD